MGGVEGIMMTKRVRPSRDEHAAWCAALVAIVEEIQPATVRQVFYQATVRGLIDKTERGRQGAARAGHPAPVGRGAVAMDRRQHPLARQPLTFGNTSEAVRWPPGSTASRCGPMPTVRCRCGIEKDAMSGGLDLVTDRFDVPLMVSRGYSSVTFLHEAAGCLTLQPALFFEGRKINTRRRIPTAGVVAGAKLEGDFLVAVRDLQWRVAAHITPRRTRGRIG